MKFYSFILFSILLSIQVFAQKENLYTYKSKYAYVYKLQEQDVLDLHLHHKKRKPESYLHTLVDSILAKEMDQYIPLKPGYYFLAYTENNDLKLEERIVNTICPQLLHNGKDFRLLLYDAHGNELKEAEVYFNGKRVAYDPVVRSYIQKGVQKKGVLKVYNKGEFLFRKIVLDQRKRNLEYYLDKTFSEPVRIMKENRRAKRKLSGYLLTDKPMYRWNDTLHLKAIVYRKNKLYRRELPLYLFYRKELGQVKEEVKHKLGVVRPDRDGNYLFHFKLADTLQIDKKYRLAFSNQKLFIDQEFLLKDYRLEDYSFNASMSQYHFSTGDTILLNLSANDILGNPLHGAEVQVQVLCTGIQVEPGLPAYLPFKILDTVIDLSKEKNAVFKILENRFPFLKGNYTMKLRFHDTNNHVKQEEFQFEYENPREKFVVETKGTSSQIRFVSEGKTLPVHGVLWMKNNKYEFYREVDFPFTYHNDQYAIPFKVVCGEKTYPVEQQSSQTPDFAFEKKGKEIRISAINPDSIKFWYQLSGDGHALAAGYSPVLDYKALSAKAGTYELKLEYFLSGQYYSTIRKFSETPGSYFVETNFPSSVSPGQTLKINAKVTTGKNKALKNINITAGAIDAKFEAKYIPVLSPATKVKWRSDEKDIAAIDNSGLQMIKNLPAGYEKLFHLDTVLYYKYSHPGAGHFYKYEPIHASHAEFAPHVFINGNKYWIYYILIDGKPVYFNCNQYSSYQVTFPYSIRTTEGYHSVSLRICDRLIELDSVYMKNGHKLDLSVNGDHNVPNRKLIVKKTENLSEKEQQLVVKKVIVKNYYASEATISTKYSDVRIENYLELMLFDKDPIVINRNGRRDTILISDSTVLLEIHTGSIDQIRSDKGKGKEKKIVLSRIPFGTLSQHPGQTLADLQQPFTKSKTGENYISPYSFYSGASTKPGNGTFFLNNSLSKNYKTYILQKLPANSGNHVYSLPVIYDVDPGFYSLTVQIDSATYLHQDSVLISSNTLTTVELSKLKKMNGIPQWHSLNLTNKYYKIGHFGTREYTMDSWLYQGRPPQSDNTVRLYSTIYYNKKEKKRKGWYFNRRYRYLSFGGGLTVSQWDNGNTWFNNPIFPLFQAFVARRYSPRLSGELNLHYLYANSSYQGSRYHTHQLIVSPFVYLDLIKHRGRYQKRPDLVPFLKTGFSLFTDLGTYHKVAGQNTHTPSVFPIQPMIPAGVGVRYKVSRQVDMRISALRYFNLLGANFGSNRSVGNFNQAEISFAYIIPSRVICPKFDGGMRRYSNYPKPIQNSTVSSQSITIAENLVLESTKKGNSPGGETTKIRKNFNEVAYWKPALKTDKKGEVEFTITFPEDITLWKNYMIGIGKNDRKFTHISYLPAILPVSAKLNTPRFVTVGDEFTVYGNLLNYTGKPVQKLHYSVYSGSQKISVDTSFLRTLSISARLVATKADTMEVTCEAVMENAASDGELRKIPVVYPGMLEIKGRTWVTGKDTTIEVQTGGILDGKLTIAASKMDEMLNDIEKLKNYPYACMEQTASKLKGLLLLKSIYQKQQKEFKEEAEVNKLIDKLEKGQKENGSWGWWPSTETDLYVTTYILKVVAQAAEMGYSVKSVEQGRAFLKRFHQDEIISYDVLLAMSELGIPIDSLNMKRVLKLGTNLTDQQKVQRLRILQLNQYPYSINDLLSLKKKTVHGGTYFGYDSYHWATNATQTTLLAYKLLKEIPAQKAELENIELYLYGIKEEGYWRNTVETAMVVDLLLSAQKEPFAKIKPTVLINDKPIPSLPYTTGVHKDSVYSIRYSASQRVYTSFYTTVWNKEPKRNTDLFNVQTIIRKDGIPVSTMKAGEIYELQVLVKVERKASYLMLEVPLPAGCLQEDKKQYNVYETYRENFKDKTNIYMSGLQPGNYSFSVFMNASYPGTYTLNPAKLSMMYFPALYGNEEAKKVEIKP